MADKLFYYSGSADKPPGKGTNESGCEKCTELAKIKDWRKMLSNFYISPFVIDGKTYMSVEHYYHSMKYRATSPQFADTFTTESQSRWCTDPILAKSAGGKSGMKGKDRLRPANCVLDPHFFSKKQSAAFTRGMFAKFTQNIELGKVLLATNNAELYHGTRGVPITRILELEKVRHCIREFYPEFLSGKLGELSKSL